MLLGGDEIGRTQQGNNNAYCQDNEISWFDWEHADRPLLEFTRRIIEFRREHPVFRRRRWFQGRAVRGAGVSDIALVPARRRARCRTQDWQTGYAKSLAVFLNGDALREIGRRRQAGARRQLPAAVQRAPRAARLHDARTAVRLSVDG